MMNGSEIPVQRLTPKIIAGGILILLGVLFMLDNFGVVDAGDLFDYWPLILVGIGLAKLVQSRGSSDRAAGVVLLVLGLIFQGNQLDFWAFKIRNVWPLLLVVAGGALIWQSSLRRKRLQELGLPDNPGERALLGARAGLEATRGLREPVAMGLREDAEESGARSAGADSRGRGPGARLDEFAMLGGGDRVVSSKDFRGGEVVAIMGGFEIDLRGADIAGDTATIDVFTLWGGVDFKIPEDWEVVVRGTPIMGVFTNSARPAKETGEARKRLVITGLAIMGGVEIKN
jgi:predicted membrane protein